MIKSLTSGLVVAVLRSNERYMMRRGVTMDGDVSISDPLKAIPSSFEQAQIQMCTFVNLYINQLF